MSGHDTPKKRPFRCRVCRCRFREKAHLKQHSRDKHERRPEPSSDLSTEPDWDGECEVCGQSPVVPVTGLCGPCTFGEADTIGGNW